MFPNAVNAVKRLAKRAYDFCKEKALELGVGVGGTAVSLSASATEEGIDVSAVTDAISGHGTVLVAIGAAVLGVLYLARVFSWGRKI